MRIEVGRAGSLGRTQGYVQRTPAQGWVGGETDFEMGTKNSKLTAPAPPH